MKVIAIIPARAGSKGIPNKNLIQVGGKPLISWSIEAALKANSINKVLVTSDGVDILKEASKHHQVDILKRPEELAQDDTPTAPVIEHALQEVKALEQGYDYLILLQPTSPLRTAEDIDGAFQAIKSSEASALISVVKPEHHPLKAFKKSEKGYLEGLVNNEFPFMPRQELPEVYQPNGAIYIIKIKEFLERKTFFTEKTMEFVMSTKNSIDIDTVDDIKKVESYVNR